MLKSSCCSLGEIGFVDDVEHYGGGAIHLPLIAQELRAASLATGIGFALPKFTAYASDWDEFVASGGATCRELSNDALVVGGWDIWVLGGGYPSQYQMKLIL